jgi:hypothetical protein
VPYQPLAQRLATLPLVVCGPVLRRVTPSSVTVFVALREQRDVSLTVHDVAANGGAGAQRCTATATTVAIGDNLHVLTITANGALQAGSTYVYTLRFASGGATQGLMDANVVRPNPADAQRALTYRASVAAAPTLPSFVAMPAEPGQVRIAHVSCRKPHGNGNDALPTVDLMIARALEATSSEPRPHLLIHTGDQIYADDVSDALLQVLIDASEALLGWDPGEELPIPSGAKGPGEVAPGTRLTVLEEGNLTSGHGRSHLFGFGEFCAMYCHAWSPTLWPAEMPGEAELYPGADDDALKDHRKHTKGQVEAIDRFRSMLGNVQRLLANVPSLMQFDDHEITDDWYRNLNWLMRSQDKATAAGRWGRTVVRNGMAAYAVFQHWGNVPDRFQAAPGPAPVAGDAILRLLNDWHAAGGMDDATSGDPTLEQLEKFLGLPEGFQPDRALRDANCMAWHFFVQWPKVQLVVLDTRTMRQTLENAKEPPALMFSDSTYAAQLDSVPRPGRDDLVIVLSPAPVFGVLAHEWISDANAAKYAMGVTRQGVGQGVAHPIRTYGVGTEETDPEHWGLVPAAHQKLLARLVSRRDPDTSGTRRSRIVILSGDVHNGSTVAARYWGTAPFGGAGAVEAAIAQLTSSASKNQEGKTEALAWGSYVDAVFPTHLIHGWRNLGGNELAITVGGETQRIRGSPALLQLAPSGGAVTPTPEWSIEVMPQTDKRASEDSGRATSAAVAAAVATAASTVGGRPPLNRVKLVGAARTLGDAAGHRKVVGRNNVGDIRFTWGSGDAKECRHRLWFHLHPSDAQPGPYTEHVVSLEIGEVGGELRYDGHTLRVGDHDRNAAGIARYGGTDRPEPAPGTALVRQLQDDLLGLGFTLVGTPDGTFGNGTAEAVREMQAAARSASTAQAPTSGGTTDNHAQVAVPAGQRHAGAVTGMADPATAAAIDRWITNGWRSPVVARSMNGANVDRDNIWGFDEVTNPNRPVVVRDLSGDWALPAGRPAGAFHACGRFEAAAGAGPIALAPQHVWPQAELLPDAAGVNLTPLTMGAGQRSTFKVVRAVSELECQGFLDVVNAWDDAVISIGPCHWTFALPGGANKAPGELAGFAAFCEHAYPDAFEAVFTRYGLRPAQTWRQVDGSPTGRPMLTNQRKYVGWWSRPDRPGTAIPSDAATADRFRSWHWVHRFQMAARTHPRWRSAMYDMARIRLRDVLSCPWGKTTGADGVPDIAGRPATIGDVVTSERAVALVHRWHIFRPADMIAANAAGPVLRAALAAVGRPAGDPATWADAFDGQYVNQLLAALPGGIGDMNGLVRWPQWGANPRGYALDRTGFESTPAVVPPGYTPPDDITVAGGLLSAHRASFLLDASGLPPAPDYANPGAP